MLSRVISSNQNADLAHHQSFTDLIELQHLAEIGRLSATLLHEISNPLTNALLQLERHGGSSSAALREAKRSIRLLRRYVDAAHQQVRHESKPIVFPVNPQLAQLKRIVRPLAQKSGVKLRFESPKNYHVHGDPVKFQQILVNLIVNAIEAYEGDLASELSKPVLVKIMPRQNDLEIQVIDRGHGIDSAQIARLFDPFYTTKTGNRHGLGIGLAIVKQYVSTELSGSISVRSSRRLGTVFVIRLPQSRTSFGNNM